MHRFVLGTPAELETDHADGDKLNNRRSNLRPATRRQNRHNTGSAPGSTSSFKGVSWATVRGRWRAQIKENGGTRHLGYFVSEEDAARAYGVAARLAHGEFAKPL